MMRLGYYPPASLGYYPPAFGAIQALGITDRLGMHAGPLYPKRIPPPLLSGLGMLNNESLFRFLPWTEGAPVFFDPFIPANWSRRP